VVRKAFSTNAARATTATAESEQWSYDRNIACLIWDDERVIVNWDWLGCGLYGCDPVLLANLFISP